MQTGDVVLVYTDHAVSKLIRFGQRLRFRGERRRFAHWNHAALVLNERGDIAEALTRGVKLGHISKYPVGSYVIVPLGASQADQAQILDFAKSVLAARWKYGYATIVALSISLLTGSKFVFGKIGTAICSGFVCEALTRAGAIFVKPPAYMTPADLAEHFDAQVGERGV